MSKRILFALVACLFPLGCIPPDPEPPPNESGDAGDGENAERDEPGAIARVRTLDDLRRQPPFALNDGVTVRFGIEARTCPVSSGILLYAYTEGYDDLVPMSSNRDRLGPCWVSVSHGGESFDDHDTHAFIPRWGGMGNKDPKVFCRPIMADRTGEFRIAVRTEDGRQLTGVTIRGVDVPFHPWSPLLLKEDAKYERIEGPYNFRRTEPARATNLGVGIGLPEVSGVIGSSATDGPLPRLLPHASDPDLRLSVEPGLVLRITQANGKVEAYRPDWHFLVRWWVNGRPYRPAWSEPIPQLGGSGTIRFANDMTIQWEPDMAACGASPGDEIGVQFLYCPNGWTPARNPQSDQHGGNGLIRMTNPATFRLPKETKAAKQEGPVDRDGGK